MVWKSAKRKPAPGDHVLIHVPAWGKRPFTGYVGEDGKRWFDMDGVELLGFNKPTMWCEVPTLP